MGFSSEALQVRRDYLTMAPEPRLFLWELPFWLALLYCALTPGSISPWWSIGDLPIRSSEGIVMVAAAWYGFAALFQLRVTGMSRWSALLTPFLAAIAWAFLSTSWNGLESDNQTAMRITLLLGFSAAIAAWGVTAGYSAEEIHHFLWRLTAFLAALSLLYTAESILSLGLRSELGQNTLLDFGIERVKGPLFGSSTGYLVLLPALAFAIHHAINVRRCRVLASLMVLILLTAMLGLGSRAALLLLSVYLVMLSFLIPSVRKRLLALSLTVSLSLLAAIVVFSQASTERLQNLEDDSRRATHVTAWTTIQHQDWTDTLRGSGYGAIWNWYLVDARNGDRLATGDNIVRTPAGFTLYHSHSTFLLMALELGIFGLSAFVAMTAALMALVLHCRRRGRWQALACGLAASAVGLFFDLFLFKNTTVNLIWWLYALGGSMLIYRKNRPHGGIGSGARIAAHVPRNCR